MNLSETAFLEWASEDLPSAACDRFRLRWFTPAREVPLCGHATLAAAAALLDGEGNTCRRLVFDTLSGELSVSRQPAGSGSSGGGGGGLLSMDLPMIQGTPDVPAGMGPGSELIKARGSWLAMARAVGWSAPPLLPPPPLRPSVPLPPHVLLVLPPAPTRTLWLMRRRRWGTSQWRQFSGQPPSATCWSCCSPVLRPGRASGRWRPTSSGCSRPPKGGSSSGSLSQCKVGGCIAAQLGFMRQDVWVSVCGGGQLHLQRCFWAKPTGVQGLGP